MTSVCLIVEHLDALLDPGATTTTGRTGYRCPGVTRSNRRDRRLGERASSSTRARERAPTSSSSTTACSGPARRARSTAPPSGACSCSSTTTWRSPPTTCRSTPTSSSATTRCSPTASAASGEPFGAHGARRSASPGASPATASPPTSSSRACARLTRPRAARLHRRPRAACARVGIVSGAGGRLPRGRDRGGPRRVRHRRADRARDGPRQETGIHFLAAGHYATETFGVRASRRPARRAGSGSRHVFVDIPNPI